jgi:2-phospho-L-lactate/phosphoenolpyruvate guanylyltransferase
MSEQMAGHEIWAVVPVKRLSQAKQRLSGVLSAEQRLRLAQAMLRDVLESLRATPALAGIVVVSADPVVHATARCFGASPIFDASESGVNDAVQQGLDALASTGHGALVVPADIPFATAEDFGSLLALVQHHQVVLSPALSDGGTNALAMQSADLIKPHFGEDSFAAHCMIAEQKQISSVVFRSTRIGRDIDIADDFRSLDFIPSNFSNLTLSLLREFEREDRRVFHDLPVVARVL